MFHKEGFTIIIVSFVLIAVATMLTEQFISLKWLRITLQITLLVFLVLILQFFRNPDRPPLALRDAVVSPVDGKVVIVKEVEEPEYFKGKRLQVSIFMSPLNVHVTRYPVSGKVVFSKYYPGKYLVAWHPKSSTLNERTTIVVDNPSYGEVLYRQIAGAVARRIVNYAEEGQTVTQGTDAGFIKFGSRVDVFLPIKTSILVKEGQVVKGGVTLITSKN
ncbi:MAG: phosphatidylserine decarboxylase family protein [Flavobacteriaceae bacterium]|jgi:phosphatidylserine decarboxylase|nr:phosphatidylserine decarboxylase family protein [Flavobacteriaceae bacterium]